MWSQDRARLRGVFYTAWKHFQAQAPLAGVETVIVETLLAHPEYQALFAREEVTEHEGGENNPFLHLGLHIALAEQIATDRPAGIVGEWRRIRDAAGDTHRAQHMMMTCLQDVLWAAQAGRRAPDEEAYIECLRALPRKTASPLAFGPDGE